MKQYGIGQPIARFEDSRLLRGRGRFQDDRNLPGQPYGVVLRSPHAHARIVSIDTAAVRAAPGVLAVYTGRIMRPMASGCRRPHYRASVRTARRCSLRQRPALVVDRVRYVGDPIAFVVAESIAQAKDAAELIVVDYEPPPAVTNTAAAAQPAAASVWMNARTIFPTSSKRETRPPRRRRSRAPYAPSSGAM